LGIASIALSCLYFQYRSDSGVFPMSSTESRLMNQGSRYQTQGFSRFGRHAFSVGRLVDDRGCLSSRHIAADDFFREGSKFRRMDRRRRVRGTRKARRRYKTKSQSDCEVVKSYHLAIEPPKGSGLKTGAPTAAGPVPVSYPLEKERDCMLQSKIL